MAFKNSEDHRAWMKKWYIEHKDAVKLRQREYEKSHKVSINKRKRKYRQRPHIAEHLRAYNLKRYHDDAEYRKRCLRLAKEKRIQKRRELIEFMGAVCQKCGFEDARALQIDHINGGGRNEFRKNPRLVKIKVYFEHIRKNRTNYQLLCANCNWIKRFENNEIPSYN